MGRITQLKCSYPAHYRTVIVYNNRRNYEVISTHRFNEVRNVIYSLYLNGEIRINNKNSTLQRLPIFSTDISHLAVKFSTSPQLLQTPWSPLVLLLRCSQITRWQTVSNMYAMLKNQSFPLGNW